YSGGRPRSNARRRVYSATAFSVGEIYLPSLRDSDASTLRTSDWETPNCLAMREGVIPALRAARTALTRPRVNATLGSSGCRRSGDSLRQSEPEHPGGLHVDDQVELARLGEVGRRAWHL